MDQFHRKGKHGVVKMEKFHLRNTRYQDSAKAAEEFNQSSSVDAMRPLNKLGL